MGASGPSGWPKLLGGRAVIFVTVGTQLAFDRLIVAVDAWAQKNPETAVFGQIGPAAQKPAHIEFADFLSPAKADELVKQADLIVAHAGMGSILTALRHQKPILIMPRKFSHGEHRNDHQMATAKWLSDRPGITVAWTEEELLKHLDSSSSISAGPKLPDVCTGPLVTKLAQFIAGQAA
jgi:UDP-N-acetylglucosamine transferase subunit ALG13